MRRGLNLKRDGSVRVEVSFDNATNVRRISSLFAIVDSGVSKSRLFVAAIKDVVRILGPRLLPYTMAITIEIFAWLRAPSIHAYFRKP